MADRDRTPPHLQSQQPNHDGGVKAMLRRKGPSAGQILVTTALLPVCGTLLGLAGITLVGSLIGLAVVTPLFVIFSPVLVPAAVLVGGAVMAFITSGAFGLTGLTSLSWVLNSFRQRMQDGSMFVGEKAKHISETLKNKAQGVGVAGGRT